MKNTKKKKKPSHARCALCGSKLSGVPKRSPSGMGKLSKTQKRPERVFGGILCPGCTRRILTEKTRLKHGALEKQEVDLRRAHYITSLK